MEAAEANPQATMVDVGLGVHLKTLLRRLQNSPVECMEVVLPADGWVD